MAIAGFFGTGTEASPGNYGLKDIVMALRWIQGNIGSFGGDPNSVTLWGHGEAASLVHMLALTKKTEGLFHRYIIQSATALCPMAVNSRTRTRKIALATARSFDCLPRNDEKNVTTTRTNVTNEEEEEGEQEELDEEHEKAMMHCLREVKDIERFRKVMNYPKQKDWRSNRCCVFAPTIEKESDDAIVTVHPLTIMEHRLFRDIPFIMGVVHDEGLYKSIGKSEQILQREVATKHCRRLKKKKNSLGLVSKLKAFTTSLVKWKRTNLSKTFRHLSKIQTSLKTSKNFLHNQIHHILEFRGSWNSGILKFWDFMIGDALVFWPAYQTLKYQSDRMNSSTYFYLFSYEGTFTSTFDSGIPKHFGVSHGDDLNYLLPILNKKYHDYMLHNTENDVTMINIMTEMWAGFATKGVPEAWKVTPWPDYKKSHRFLRLGAGKLSDIAEESELFPKRMAFWEELTANLTLNPIDFDFPQYIEDDESNSSVPKQRSEMFICLTMLLAICFL
ncbi:hypothetical protein E2986_05174 [Frieseomelitta varia]|uniref:Carboxylesterase type B domain-containing protein n=1 Tax=Frieseomelitta varia TaxID=561572 RepID=A0A833RQD2_9HYME|nr:hypothetical protein E2986_05174 [Frieseomelitta varia]